MTTARELDKFQLIMDSCRLKHHAWDEIDPTKPSPIGWYEWYRCLRCETIRKDTVDVHGDLSARSYKHPWWWKQVVRDNIQDLRVRQHNRSKRRRRMAA